MTTHMTTKNNYIHVPSLFDNYDISDKKPIVQAINKRRQQLLKLTNFGISYDKIIIKSGKHGFPKIKPYYGEIPSNYIDFGDVKPKGCDNCCVTGYEYDYILMNLWNSFDEYVPILSKSLCVCNPDYSMYVDSGLATQISNKLKSHEVAYMVQENRIAILPSMTWSSTRSYDFCFDGYG